MLTQAEKCNIAYSCTFHFCLLSKYIELALLLAPCTQRFLLNVWLYLKKMSDWATFRQNKQHRQHDQLPNGACSLTLVLTLPGGGGQGDSGAESEGCGDRLHMFIPYLDYLVSQFPHL